MAQSFESVWTVIENREIQNIWARTFNEISKKIDSLIYRQMKSDNIPEQQAIEMMPSFYLTKLIFNQFLPKALQIHKRTVKTLQMFVFAETLCRETEVV